MKRVKCNLSKVVSNPGSALSKADLMFIKCPKIKTSFLIDYACLSSSLRKFIHFIVDKLHTLANVAQFLH